MKAEGIRRGADHVRQVTVIGDGAAWIWNLAAATFPEATCIVDLYHAREHLHSLTQSLAFMLGDYQQSGSPPGSKTSTTATSTASRPPSANTRWKESRRTRWPGNSATS